MHFVRATRLALSVASVGYCLVVLLYRDAVPELCHLSKNKLLQAIGPAACARAGFVKDFNTIDAVDGLSFTRQYVQQYTQQDRIEQSCVKESCSKTKLNCIATEGIG